ncbi:hypothetical protein ACWXWG_11000 [Pantoea ananatis]
MAWYDSAGNASDIVSAVCNMTTLAVTVYIAFKANDFLKSKIRDEGFKRGAEILDEIDTLYDLTIPIHARYNSLKRDHKMAFGDENYNNLSGESVLERYNDFINEVIRLKSSIKRIRILLYRLNRWGIVIMHESMISDVLSSAEIFLHSNHAMTEQTLSCHWSFMDEYLQTTYQESKVAEENHEQQYVTFEEKYKLLLDYKLEDFFKA